MTPESQSEHSDSLPEALRLAREVRAGGTQYSPHKLHEASAGDMELYRHAMVEAGYVAQGLAKGEPFRANDPCPYCGHEFGNRRTPPGVSVAVPEGEAAAHLNELVRGFGGVPRDEYDAMVAARDHCKQQATEAGERWTALRRWLRDEHPDVYTAIPDGP